MIYSTIHNERVWEIHDIYGKFSGNIGKPFLVDCDCRYRTAGSSDSFFIPCREKCKRKKVCLTGRSMDHFVLQHMAEHFTRLIIISAGRYSKDIVSLAQRIGVTVLSIVEDAGLTAGIVQPSEEMIEISVDDLSKEVFRLIC